jgi:hypothetical protein
MTPGVLRVPLAGAGLPGYFARLSLCRQRASLRLQSAMRPRWLGHGFDYPDNTVRA